MSGIVLLARFNGTSDLCLNRKTVLVQVADISVVLGCQGYNLTVFVFWVFFFFVLFFLVGKKISQSAVCVKKIALYNYLVLMNVSNS